MKNMFFIISILSILFLFSCSGEDPNVEKNYIQASSGTYSLKTRQTEVTRNHDSTVIDYYKTEDFAVTDFGEEYYQIDTIKLTDTKISLFTDDKTLDGEKYNKIFNNLEYEQVESILSFNYTIDFEESFWLGVDDENSIWTIQRLLIYTTKDSSLVDDTLSQQVGYFVNFGGFISLVQPEYYTSYSTTFYYSK